jgi:hypothetical protein
MEKLLIFNKAHLSNIFFLLLDDIAFLYPNFYPNSFQVVHVVTNSINYMSVKLSIIPIVI